MTDNTELIALARSVVSWNRADEVTGRDDELLTNLAGALEVAEQRIAELEAANDRWQRQYGELSIKKLDLAAAIERLRELAKTDIPTLLNEALGDYPLDAIVVLRERDADRWDEGYLVAKSDAYFGRVFAQPKNPYREEPKR